MLRKWLVRTVLGVTAVLGILVVGWFGWPVLDEPPSMSTDTRSSQLKTSAERVEFLGRYLKLRTPVKDTVFHVVFHDNGGQVPGPSDWSIAAALLVTPADGPAWLAGARPATAEDEPLRQRLVPPEWKVSSAGEAYVRDGSRLVWHPEGVLEFGSSTR